MAQKYVLNCSVAIRLRVPVNMPLASSKKATIMLLKGETVDDIKLLVVSPANKSGNSYKVSKDNFKLYKQFAKDGKVTMEFSTPPHNISISAEPSKLIAFLKGMSLDNNETLPASNTEQAKKILKTHMNKKVEFIYVKQRSPELQAMPKDTTALTVQQCSLHRIGGDILRLQQLRELKLTENKLMTLPVELGDLKLNHLSLSGNELTSDWDTWQFLYGPIKQTLQTLDISHNKMVAIPGSVTHLRYLTSLRADHNDICHIPPLVLSLPRLSELNVSDNQLLSIPLTLSRYGQRVLETLDVGNNPTLYIPYEPRHTITKDEAVIPNLQDLAAHVIRKARLEYAGQLPVMLTKELDEGLVCACAKCHVVLATRARRAEAQYKVLVSGRHVSITYVYGNLNNSSAPADGIICTFTPTTRCFKHLPVNHLISVTRNKLSVL